MKSILAKILELAILLLASTTLIFFLVSISPIDPITSNYGQVATSKMTSEKLDLMREYWGVGLPFYERLFQWLGNLLRLDFGQSLIYNEPVLDIILRGLKNSALIMALSWAIGGALGYVLGLISACNKNSCFTKLTTSINYLLISTPTYWLAIILLFLFCISLNLVSLNSNNAFEQAILPTLTLTLFSAPTIFFHTKTKCETLLKSDFVKYAKIKGESKSSLIKNHLLKNSSLPAISVQFAQIGEVIGSSVVAETVFSYPGLGFITVKAATSSDVFLLAGISVVTLFIVFVGNIISNILVSSIDPRIKAIKWAR